MKAPNFAAMKPGNNNGCVFRMAFASVHFAFGSHSSILFPSGSYTHAKRP